MKKALKIIIALETVCLCYYLFNIAALTFAELNSAKSYKEINGVSYQKKRNSYRGIAL